MPDSGRPDPRTAVGPDGMGLADSAEPWQARPPGMLLAGTLAATSSVAALILVLISALWPVALGLLALSAGTVSGTWWARRRRRLAPPAGHRAAVLARFLHAWSVYLCLVAAGPLVFGATEPAGPPESAAPGNSGSSGNLVFMLAQSVLLSAVAAQARSTRGVGDPAGQRPGSHLTCRQRRDITAAVRADRVLDAAHDRDVRAVVHRLLDRELAGWGALGAALLLLSLIPFALQGSPWLLAVAVLAAVALGVAGWHVLAVVRAAKRRQVWLNTHRPAPHLERPARDDSGRRSGTGRDAQDSR